MVKSLQRICGKNWKFDIRAFVASKASASGRSATQDPNTKFRNTFHPFLGFTRSPVFATFTRGLRQFSMVLWCAWNVFTFERSCVLRFIGEWWRGFERLASSVVGRYAASVLLQEMSRRRRSSEAFKGSHGLDTTAVLQWAMWLVIYP